MLMRRGAQRRRAAALLKKTLARPANASLRPSRPARLTQAAMSRVRRAVERKRDWAKRPRFRDSRPTITPRPSGSCTAPAPEAAF